jgi:hypothetical protein
MSNQPHNTKRYHGLNETELQSQIYRLDTVNAELLAALRTLSEDIEARAYHLDNSTLAALETARAAIANAQAK